MVMFSNCVDLWLAVTIILPFTPAGWRNQAGQLEPGGEESRGENARPKLEERQVNTTTENAAGARGMEMNEGIRE